jgi:hypothetical protein
VFGGVPEREGKACKYYKNKYKMFNINF